MARIRTIKPEFWTAEQIMELSPMARLLFIGMWNFCDDKGVHPVAYKTLKAEVFPADDLLSSDVERLVAEITAQGLLSEFEAEGRRWWFVTGWHHQVINRPSKSRYPVPPRNAPLPTAAGQDDYDVETPSETTDHGTLIDGSLSAHGVLTDGREEEGKGREGSKPPTPPTARDGEFSMDLDWSPSSHFPTLARQAGIPADRITAESIAEFRSYWIGQGAVLTQHQWDHKLLTNLKAQKARAQSPPSRASPGRRQPQTLSEQRTAAAKVIFAPGPAGANDGHERRTIDVTPAVTDGLDQKALR